CARKLDLQEMQDLGVVEQPRVLALEVHPLHLWHGTPASRLLALSDRHGVSRSSTGRCASLSLVGRPWRTSDRQNSTVDCVGERSKKRGSPEHRRNLFFHRPTTVPKMAVGEGNDSDTH